MTIFLWRKFLLASSQRRTPTTGKRSLRKAPAPLCSPRNLMLLMFLSPHQRQANLPEKAPSDTSQLSKESISPEWRVRLGGKPRLLKQQGSSLRHGLSSALRPIFLLELPSATSSSD